MIAEGKSANFVMKQFLKFLGDSYVVAHNASFDLRMLNNTIKRLKFPSEIDKSRVFCTMSIFRVKIEILIILLESLSRNKKVES